MRAATPPRERGRHGPQQSQHLTRDLRREVRDWSCEAGDQLPCLRVVGGPVCLALPVHLSINHGNPGDKDGAPRRRFFPRPDSPRGSHVRARRPRRGFPHLPSHAPPDMSTTVSRRVWAKRDGGFFTTSTRYGYRRNRQCPSGSPMATTFLASRVRTMARPFS